MPFFLSSKAMLILGVVGTGSGIAGLYVFKFFNNKQENEFTPTEQQKQGEKSKNKQEENKNNEEESKNIQGEVANDSTEQQDNADTNEQNLIKIERKPYVKKTKTVAKKSTEQKEESISYDVKNHVVTQFSDLKTFITESNNLDTTTKYLQDLHKNMQIASNCIDTEGLKQIDKTKIPYSVDDEEILKHTCELPESTENIHYWTDIQKDNAKGEITIAVYGRAYKFHGYIIDDVTYDKKFESHTITGFQKKDPLEIIKERIVGVYINYNANQWLEDWYSYDDFSYDGSGVIFKKDDNKPKYYIFTNKHLFLNATIRTKKLENNKDASMSFIDDRSYEDEDYDLKNFITFGSASKDNLSAINYSVEDEISNAYKKTFLNKDHIKEIKLVKDFSEKFTRNIDKNQVFFNLNRNYNQLVTAKDDKKITLDAVIFSVEFKDDANDPYKSWWNERPTQHRLLQRQDLTTDHPLERYLTNQQNTKQNKKVYTAGFQWKKFKNSFTDLAVAQGDLAISRYVFKDQWFNEYNPYGKRGNVNYSNFYDKLTEGSSGGGVFDENLKIIGVNWGGSTNPYTQPPYSVFNWWGVDSELEEIYAKNDDTMHQQLKDAQAACKTYNYIDF